MRVALVHDYLNQLGGAERVLETLAEIFPDAPIYTLLYDEKKTAGKFSAKVQKTSFLDFAFARSNHRLFIPLMPLAAATMAIDNDYDLIISSTAGYAKGIKFGSAFHISYCHTPLRYAWEQQEYLRTLISNFQFLISKPLLNYLKWWDYKAGQKPDILIANSRFIADKIKKYYGREAKVIYPPVDLNVFYPNPAPKYKILNTKYFLAIGRLMHYKRFDLIVDAFNKLNLPLRIVGDGPELENLKKRASGNNIKFFPFTSDINELRKIYNGARALIFPQVEDFGLVAAEAVACGTPVIAYNAGGAKEIVNENCGVFFDKQEPETLQNAVSEFLKKEKRFGQKTIAAQAKKFSKENFKKSLLEIIESRLKSV